MRPFGARLTSFGVADIRHDLRGTLDINLHAVGFETLYDDAHSPESRNEIKGPDHTELQEMGVLKDTCVSLGDQGCRRVCSYAHLAARLQGIFELPALRTRRSDYRLDQSLGPVDDTRLLGKSVTVCSGSRFAPALVQCPSSPFEHLDVKRIAQNLAIDQLERMTGRQCVKQRRLPAQAASIGNFGDLAVEFAKPLTVLVDGTDTEYVQAVFCKGTSLVETEHVDFASDVDTIGRNAEDAELSKSIDGKGRSDREGGGQGGGDDDGD